MRASLSEQMVQDEELYLRISPDRFHYLKFILEGYDNLAVLSSHGSGDGLVRLRYLSISRKELIELLSAIARELTPNWRAAATTTPPGQQDV